MRFSLTTHTGAIKIRAYREHTSIQSEVRPQRRRMAYAYCSPIREWFGPLLNYTYSRFCHARASRVCVFV